MDNIHQKCVNYNESKDFCLKWFEKGVSRLKTCKELQTIDTYDVNSKWSN